MNIVKSSLVAAFVLVGALGIGQSAYAGPTAGSYNVNITCGSFNNDQHSAQVYFDTYDHPANLDQNGDGKACADPSDGDFTSTGPSAGSYNVNITCDSFNNDLNAAQKYFDENDSPANLDEDGDGIACNDIVLVYETPAVTSAEEAVPESTTSEETVPEPAVAIDALPNTGVGTTQPASNTMPAIIAMGLALVAGASTVAARRK